MAHNKAGRPVYRFVVLRKGIGSHDLDCETYARAMAEMVTGGVWDNLAERFRAAVEAQRQAERAARVGSGTTATGKSFIRRPSSGFGRR